MISKLKDVSIWGPHVCVLSAYAATYQIALLASVSCWLITSSLRLTCMLLVSRRFWPALAFAEFICLAQRCGMNADRFGIAWAIVASIPAIVVCMPPMLLLRKHSVLFDRYGQTHMPVVVLALFTCSVMSAASSMLAIPFVDMADGSSSIPFSSKNFLNYLAGYYVGALTVTPCVLAIRDRLAQIDGELVWRHIIESRLIRDVLMYALPMLLTIMIFMYFTGGQTLPYFRFALVVPVVILTVRHGWHGGAVGGMLASFALESTTLAFRDPSLLPHLAILCMVLSLCLMQPSRSTPVDDSKNHLRMKSRGNSLTIAARWMNEPVVPLKSWWRHASPFLKSLPATVFRPDGAKEPAS